MSVTVEYFHGRGTRELILQMLKMVERINPGGHPPPVGVCDTIHSRGRPLVPPELGHHLLWGELGLEDITLIISSGHSRVVRLPGWEQPGGRWAQWGRFGKHGGEVLHKVLVGYFTVDRRGVVEETSHTDARVSSVQLL